MFLSHALKVLNDLSRALLSAPPDDFLQQVADKAAELLSGSVCIVWGFDKQRGRLRVAATTDGVDEEFKRVELPVDSPGVMTLLSRGKTSYLSDVRESHPNYYMHQEEARRRGWVSLLSTPMWANDELVGVLDVYTDSPCSFAPFQKALFDTFAYQAAVAIQKAELYREAVSARQRLQAVNYGISVANSVEEVLRLLLEGSLGLVNTSRGWISLLDPVSGAMEIISYRGDLKTRRPLNVGEGIAGLALRKERSFRADDVTAEEWRKVYVEYWPDTRSVLSIPILVATAQVRIGGRIESRSKPLGVLNIESEKPFAFSDIDVESLWSCACIAAVMIENLELDRKLRELSLVETEIVRERSFDATMRLVMKAITGALGYDYVNVSLITPEHDRIRTEYITGVPDDQVEAFKRMSVHLLDSNDIQADVVRHKRIEVPARDDERFDKAIFSRFGAKELLRVFMPLTVLPDGRVIGTVEAGYQNPGYRKYIYERDVQILQSFLNYAVQALEQRNKMLLETITHEFRSSLVGIRSNASYLKRRGQSLSDEQVARKLDDIMVDCMSLFSQVGELEYILGRPMPPATPAYTLVMRDIVIKTIQQLRPLVVERGFNVGNIEYNPDDAGKIRVYVDQRKLNQVVINLLINSIKYAEDEPDRFKVRISAEQTPAAYVIKFEDWGIGIPTGLEEKIFEQGFRAPNAIMRNVTGSGLGLAIGRKIMRGLDGDLILASGYKPTEFQLILPKKLKEKPNDPIR